MIAFSRLGSWGQLGNQMFQYAALLGVAQRRGFEPFVPPLHEHALGQVFRPSATILTRRDRRRLRYDYRDERLGFRPQLEHVPARCDIVGLFQSPRHFPTLDVLRRELTFRDQHRDTASARLEELRRDADRLVALTVRRGDYLVHREVFVQVWEGDYYDRAMRELAGEGTRFVVSSDDAAWCRARFERDDVCFVDDLPDPTQLAVLAGCDDCIIANGTFGWWSAWLGDKPGRRVLAPRRWFMPNDRYVERERSPLPAGWCER